MPPIVTTTVDLLFEDGTRLLYREYLNMAQGLDELIAGIQSNAFAVYYMKLQLDKAPTGVAADIGIAVQDGGSGSPIALNTAGSGGLRLILGAVFPTTYDTSRFLEWGSPRAPSGLVVERGKHLVIQNKYNGNDVGVRLQVCYSPAINPIAGRL